MLKADADIHCEGSEICVVRRHLASKVCWINKITFHNEVLKRTIHKTSLIRAINSEVALTGLVEMQSLYGNFVPLLGQGP